MLKSLQILNFQAHSKLKVNFDPSVTVFVGPSDVGKSAVIRALRWLATDRPLGDTFIREGTDTCTMVLETDTDRIGRRKGGSNVYRLNDSIFKAWGSSGPPDEIVKAVNLSAVNFQGQHDPPFWFCLSPGEVGKELNSIVDLSAIDDVLAAVASEKRASRSRGEVARERLRASEEYAKHHERVPSLVTDFESLKEKERTVFSKKGKSLAVTRAVDTLHEYDDTRTVFRDAVVEMKKVVAIGNAAAALYRRASDLSEVVGNAKKFEGYAKRKLPCVDGLEKYAEKLRAADKNLEELQRLLGSYNEWEEKRLEVEGRLVEAKKEMKEEVGDTCPVCGSPIQL